MLNSRHQYLPEESRRDVIDSLNKRVADAIDLVYQAKQAHWNVKGFEFRSLHKLFDEVADEVDPFIDLLAERISQLGGVVQGTVQAAARSTSLQEYSLDLLDEKAHLRALCEGVFRFSKAIHEDISRCEEFSDHVTADILTEIVRATDKLGWMLESHLFEWEAGESDAIQIEKRRERRASSA